MNPPFNALDISELKNLPKASGIYFVIVDDSICYIGQSSKLQSRWAKHGIIGRCESAIDSGSRVRLAWLELDSQSIVHAENVMLHRVRPEWNQQFPVSEAEPTAYCGEYQFRHPSSCVICEQRFLLSGEHSDLLIGAMAIADTLREKWGYLIPSSQHHSQCLELLLPVMPEFASRVKDRICEINAAMKAMDSYQSEIKRWICLSRSLEITIENVIGQPSPMKPEYNELERIVNSTKANRIRTNANRREARPTAHYLSVA